LAIECPVQLCPRVSYGKKKQVFLGESGHDISEFVDALVDVLNHGLCQHSRLSGLVVKKSKSFLESLQVRKQY
jgi:hypothetical protein